MEILKDIDSLIPMNYRSIDEKHLESLIDSIRTVGIREPVRVFEVRETKQRYLLCGHHRVEAVKRLRKLNDTPCEVPAFVEKGSEEDLRSMRKVADSVVSNVLHSKLNLIERAAAYKKLRDSGMSILDIGRVVGDSDRTVRNVLDVSLLTDNVKQYINREGIKEAKVYKVVAKWKRDATIDLIRELSSTREQNIPKTETIKIDIDRLRMALKNKIKLTDNQIESLIASVT